MADRKYFVLCQNNCKYEGMTKEQVLAAIAEATGKTVTDIDNAFITKIKEINKGAAVQIWLGTVSEYNRLVLRGEIRSDVYYIKTNDTRIDDIEHSIVVLNENVEAASVAAKNYADEKKTEAKEYAYKLNNIALSQIEAAITTVKNYADEKKDEAQNYAYTAANTVQTDVKRVESKFNTQIFKLNATDVQSNGYYSKNLSFQTGTTAAALYSAINDGKNVEIRAFTSNGDYFKVEVAECYPSENTFLLKATYSNGGMMTTYWELTSSGITRRNDVLMYDYIVEEGKTNGWHYRKWASGIAECWGIVDMLVSKKGEIGAVAGVSTLAGYFALPDFVCTQTTFEATVNANPVDWWFMGCQANHYGNKAAATLYGLTASMTDIAVNDTIKMNFSVIGRWQ